MLLARAAGDGALLDALVARRLRGEPLAWITGTATFCGLPVGVSFLGPRWSEPRLLGLAYAFEQATQARRAPALLPSIARAAPAPPPANPAAKQPS